MYQKHIIRQNVLVKKSVLGSLLLALIRMNTTQRFGLGKYNWVQSYPKNSATHVAKCHKKR